MWARQVVQRGGGLGKQASCTGHKAVPRAVTERRWCVPGCLLGAACPAFLSDIQPGDVAATCSSPPGTFWSILSARILPSTSSVKNAACCHLHWFLRGGSAIWIIYCLSPSFPQPGLWVPWHCFGPPGQLQRCDMGQSQGCECRVLAACCHGQRHACSNMQVWVFFFFACLLCWLAHLLFLTHDIRERLAIKSWMYFLSISGCLVKCQKYNCFRELVSFYVQKAKGREREFCLC